MSEPSTGYIFGLEHYPTFDPNHYRKCDIDTHQNRGGLSDIFEPEPVFKMVTAAQALLMNLCCI